ncbi:MAG: hypothetical protein WAU01_02435 [Saprospiraceae bacterium]
MLIPYEKLDAQSRVWIYQASDILTSDQVLGIKTELNEFLEDWTAHNAQLFTFGDVYYDRFLVIFADERFTGASGCSIDKSVHFIENIEKKYGISLLGRMQVAYLDGLKSDAKSIMTSPLNDLQGLFADGVINSQTLVFDNLVKTKADFESKWTKPLQESWHKRFV